MPAEPQTRRINEQRDEKQDEKQGEKRDEKQGEKRSTDQRIADLEAALAASRAAAPLNPIPYHGAGAGTEIAETWSLYEQQIARKNEAEDIGPEHPVP